MKKDKSKKSTRPQREEKERNCRDWFVFGLLYLHRTSHSLHLTRSPINPLLWLWRWLGTGRWDGKQFGTANNGNKKDPNASGGRR
jgi:hypothetical protein